MSTKTKNVDFTNGRIFKNLVFFILPIVATNLLQALYNAADMMVVGLSSEKNAVGAIGTTGAFINLIVNVFIGFSVGANVTVARHIGAKNKEKTGQAVHTALIMAVLFGMLGLLVGVSVSSTVLKAMGNQGNLLKLATRYCIIYFLGVPFLSLTNYLVAIFNAKGDAKTPLIALTFAGFANVGLNLLFVLAFQMSVEGVATATAISNFLSASVLLIKLRRDRDDTTFSFKKLKINFTAMKDIIVIGLPAGIQGALFSISNMLIQSSVVAVNNALCPAGSTYEPIVSGNAAAGNLEAIVYTASHAVYQGAITFTSQNIGAQKPHRVNRIMYLGFLLTSIISMTMVLFIFLFKQPLLSLYSIKGGEAGSLEALAMYAATTRMKYMFTFYFLCGIMEVTSGVLRGLGKSLTSTIISLIGACLFRIAWIVLIFPLDKTLENIFISYPISWFLTGLVSFIVIQVILKKILNKKQSEPVIE